MDIKTLFFLPSCPSALCHEHSSNSFLYRQAITIGRAALSSIFLLVQQNPFTVTAPPLEMPSQSRGG